MFRYFDNMADTKTPAAVTVQALTPPLAIVPAAPAASSPNTKITFPPWNEALAQHYAKKRNEHARRIVWYTEEYNAKIKEMVVDLATTHKQLLEYMIAVDKDEKKGVVSIHYDPKGVRVLDAAELRDIYETLRAAKPDFYYLQCLEHLVDVAQIRGIYAEADVTLPAWFTTRYGAPEPAAPLG